MAAPLTLYGKTEGNSFFEKTDSGYKQVKPYNLVTWRRASLINGSVTSSSVDYVGAASPPYVRPVFTGPTTTGYKLRSVEGTHGMSDYGRRQAACYNQAYAKFTSALSSGTAGWAENIAQMQKSIDMIAGRTAQFYRFIKAASRRDLRGMASALYVPRAVAVKHGVKKDLAKTVLEWEFGWSPLISDIRGSLDHLVKTDFGERKVFGAARESWSERSVIKTNGDFQSVTTSTVSKSNTMRVRCFATMRITNPNLYLAHQLGVLDVALPWKLLPFSFVVDWFVNVEQVLGSLTPFLGLDLTDAGWSKKDDFTYSASDVMFGKKYFSGSYYQIESRAIYQLTQKRYQRDVGIPGPTLVVKPFKGFSPKRGLDAVALVTTFFKSV